MTDTPPDQGSEEWMSRPAFPSEEFGGTRGEVWTPVQAAELFVGSWMLNDGMTLLRALMDTAPDDPEADRTALIADAADWTETANEWMRSYVMKEADKDTDLGEAMRSTTANIGFLSGSMAEHVHRLAGR